MKPKILYINSVCGFGSTGRIVAELSNSKEFDSLVCYGRKKDYANVNSYKFATFFDSVFGALNTIFFDNNLNICSSATKKLIKKIKEYNPDIIHLHNIHGYYLNVEMLFNFLKDYNKPIVWTMHDCWPLTGYCATADYLGCTKYQSKCSNCPQGFAYPFSLFKQNLQSDFYKKKSLFNSIKNMTIVTPSIWMHDICKLSFLKEYSIQIINNGIKLDKFKPSKDKNKQFTIISVANVWTEDRGMYELEKLIPLLDKDIEVIVVGTGSDRFRNCTAIKHTNSINELVDLYSSSHVLINQTLDDNFPTVNIESIACGTPVLTYKTGGSPEIIDDKTGIVIDKGDYTMMANTINLLKNNYYFKQGDCLKRSKMFSVEKMLSEYYSLYKSILK